MSTEDSLRDAPAADVDASMQDSQLGAAPAAGTGGRRPRLNLNALGLGGGGGERGERKRGKSMFGVLVNTLNRAKAEDKERNASEAAKKRQLIDQRLQNKLKKDADSVRMVEESKKDRAIAGRKEEDLQFRDSIAKLRRTRLPLLANFLLTSDVIPTSDTDMDSDSNFQISSILPPRSHPPPLYYLPAVLTPEQESFLSKRRTQTKNAAEKEWEQFKIERAAGIEEISSLRQKVAAVQSNQRQDNGNENTENTQASTNGDAIVKTEVVSNVVNAGVLSKDTEMDAENGAKNADMGSKGSEALKTEEEKDHPMAVVPPPTVDEDDAVEY